MPTGGMLTDLLSRWEEQHLQGRPVAVEELCRDCPELLPQLREAIEALRATPTVVETTSTAQPETSAGETPTAEVCACPAVAGYEMLGELGHGGMGVVYQARDLRLDRVVALKMLHGPDECDSDRLARFLTEARVMARLDHPHIVPIYERDESEGKPYFTMKLLPGGSLAKHLPRLGADVPAAVRLMEKVARGVHYLHTEKLLHRDLKPQNILLGEHDEPFVTDFGLVKLLEGSLDSTLPGMVMGTLPYMAPEQATGQAHRYGPATDVWALGVILFELLTGKKPFASPDRIELASQILSAEPAAPRSLRPDLADNLEGVILKCLRKDPAERYPSAEALADDLARLGSGEPMAWPPRRRRLSLPRLRGQVRRKPMLWAGILLLVLAAGLGYGAWRTTPLPRRTLEPKAESARVLLLGPTGPPLQSRWIVGEERTIVEQGADGAFSLRAPKVALLELRAKAPPLPFKLEAEIRHEESEEGNVGLVFAYHPSWSDRQLHHSFCPLTFADKGRSRNTLRLSLCRSPESRPWAVVGNNAVRAEPIGSSEAGSDWRKLALVVTGDEVSCYLDGKRYARVSRARFKDLKELMETTTSPGGWDFTPEGGLGLCLFRGRASFRNVILTAPPEAPPE